MTIRQYIKRRVRWAALILVAGFAIFALPDTILDAQHKFSGAWNVLRFAMALPFLAGIILLHNIRCPRCKSGLGETIAWAVTFPNFRPRPRHCPFCSVSLDEPMPAIQDDLGK